MSFKSLQRPVASAETPELLFGDLRNRKIAGLLSHQADILRNYYQLIAKDKQPFAIGDIALQMPTGSGKTLVGLLIGEWRRRRFSQRVAYFCPTKQLVNQVVAQGIDYGIRAIPLTGKQANYPANLKSDYLTGDAIAVTTYSALFNTNSFFDNCDTIVLDDAHAGENYVAKYWSVQVERWGEKAFPVLYAALVTALRDALSYECYERLSTPSPSPSDKQWVDKIALPMISEQVRRSLIALLDEMVQQTDHRYSWSVIRDHFDACQIYLCPDSICIRPLISPSFSHSPFSSPSQRLYMSATLGEGGELERIWGRYPIHRLSLPDGWDKQGVGRRFFIFPEKSLESNMVGELLVQLIKRVPRSLLLVQNNVTETNYSKFIRDATGYKIFNADQLEESKLPFVETSGAVVIVANRYDGIDLVGDECRLLMVCDLPRAMNLQERFLVTRLSAGILLKERNITRITQAVGRCTRSTTDYAAVVIIGQDLNKFLLQRDNRKHLHPELQAELEYGIQQSSNVGISDFIENLDIFLEHKLSWDNADQDIINLREELVQSTLPGNEKLQKAVVDEINYQKQIWTGDFEGAIQSARNVLAIICGDELFGYRSFWNYLAGNAAWLASRQGNSSLEAVARSHYRTASRTAPGIRWLMDLSKMSTETTDASQEEDLFLSIVIDGLERQLIEIGSITSRKFEAKVASIIEGISSDEASKFEPSHEQLGKILGFTTGRGGSDEATPDVWWCVADRLCFVFEDHTNLKAPDDNISLGANKVRQAASHQNWIRSNVRLLSTARIVSIIITPRKTIMPGAVPHTGDVCIWNIDEFRKWSVESVNTIRKLWATFPEEGNLEWRLATTREYKDSSIDPSSLEVKMRACPLNACKIS